ncbi:MAG TPA: hypothetical protein G4O04_00955 [Anaerolineae bacterium]|nr:hypothetical protein [Anaerolineae bacterium]HIQ09884.1 hypothetical protein [Anaerolineaceae bacterium]
MSVLSKRLTWRTRTWYGLPTTITVSTSNMHKVQADRVTLPHPGVVNTVVRAGLPWSTRLALTAQHELGHLQTLPVPVAHSLLLWVLRPRRNGGRMRRWAWGLLAHQAVWEVAAEGYVLFADRRAWHAPRPRWARVLYGAFWVAMMLLGLKSTYEAVRSSPFSAAGES